MRLSFVRGIVVGAILLSAGCNPAPQQAASPAPQQASGSSGAATAPSSPFASAMARKTYDAPPAMKIDTSKHYSAAIDTTAGRIVIDLFAAEAPKTVNSFVFLSREGFYNGIIFHRVIPGFMIQGGDPTGSGKGGPGYEFENENRDTKRTYVKGTIGMANAGLNTNGSQFFIMDADNRLPPSGYTIFGAVKEGQDIVNKIAVAPRNEEDRPDNPVSIKSITINEE